MRQREEAGMNYAKLHKKTRFLKTGWWLLHLAVIATVYALGHFLW
jgi:hypothetical protein